MKIQSTELIIVYDNGDGLIQLSHSTFDNSTFKLAILYKETDKETGETSIEFNSVAELRTIITNFETKFNKIKK